MFAQICDTTLLWSRMWCKHPYLASLHPWALGAPVLRPQMSSGAIYTTYPVHTINKLLLKLKNVFLVHSPSFRPKLHVCAFLVRCSVFVTFGKDLCSLFLRENHLCKLICTCGTEVPYLSEVVTPLQSLCHSSRCSELFPVSYWCGPLNLPTAIPSVHLFKQLLNSVWNYLIN